MQQQREERLLEAIGETIGKHLKECAEMYIRHLEATTASPENYTPAPLSMSDEEVELRYQHELGNLSAQDLEKLLESAGVPIQFQ